MAESKHSVSGSWLGNYYYSSGSQPFGFEAVFVEMNGSVEGSIMDDGQLKEANVFGKFADPMITFTKKYTNSALQVVKYQGTMSDDGKKMSGTWNIDSKVAGSWLAWRQEEEEIPDLETQDQTDDGLYQDEEREKEKVMVRPMHSKQR